MKCGKEQRAGVCGLGRQSSEAGREYPHHTTRRFQNSEKVRSDPQKSENIPAPWLGSPTHHQSLFARSRQKHAGCAEAALTSYKKRARAARLWAPIIIPCGTETETTFICTCSPQGERDSVHTEDTSGPALYILLCDCAVLVVYIIIITTSSSTAPIERQKQPVDLCVCVLTL